MDLKNGMVIRCNNEEEAKEFIKEAYKQGFKWVNIDGCGEKTCWSYVCDFNSEIYYHLVADEIAWSSRYSGNNSIEYSTLKEKIKTMTKSDLKNGMVVELQNKGMYLVHNGMLLNQKGTGHMSLYCRRGYYGEEYNEDLTRPNDSNWDIIRVYKSDAHNLKDMFAKDSLELIWEREEKQELSNEDKQIIKKGLKKVQELCKKHPYCDGCELHKDKKCPCMFLDEFDMDKLFED